MIGHILSRGAQILASVLLLAAMPLAASTLDPSGDLDTSFATTGKGQFNYKTVTVSSDSRAIIQQASGKVVIGGGSNNGIYKDYLVMRMNPDGTLDPSFGVGSFGLPGVTIVDMSFDDHINGLAQNSDGSRFCGGGISNWDFGIACFTRDGLLDTTFNTSGTPPGTFKSNAPGSGGGGRILGMTFDRSDRLIAIGYAPGPTTRDVFLHRFNTNGTDDNSFGTNGWVRIDVNGGSDRGFDVAVLKGASPATDQLVAVGTSGSHPFIAVLNANGSLDTSSHALTGTNGIFNPAVNPQGDNIWEGVAVDSSNNIYVTGQGGGFHVEKYNLANAAAIAQTGNLGGANSSNDVGFRVRIATVAGNERVYASGTANAGVDFDVARLTLALAPEFNTGTSLSSGSDFAYDVAVNSSTGYVTATGVTFGDLNTVGVTRYDTAGNLDTGFNGTGKYYAQIQGGSGDFTAAFAVQSDGNAIVAGTTFTSNGDYDLLVTRVKTDGTRDTTGWASATGGWDQRGFSAGSAEQMNPGGVAIDSNGKAVVVGTSNGYFAIRYNTDGTLDTTFNTTGYVLGNWGTNSEGKVVAIDSSNNVIVGGDITLNGDFKVSRLAASNGALDTTFGTSGIATVDISSGKSDVLKAIAIDPSGRIVLGGECIVHVVTTDFFKMCLARLNTDGTLDTTFNGTGKVLLNISGNDTFDIRSLQLLPNLDTPSTTDYKIVVAGQFVQSSPSQAMWLVARFNMDGSLDTSFNGTGYKTLVPGFDTTTSKPYVGSANSVALQYDEKLIVVGESAQPDPLNSCCVLARLITVARLNWDGSLDTTYGTSSANPGFTYTSFGSDPSEAYQAYVYPQSNSALKGRALLTPFIIASDFAMSRYLADPAPIVGASAPDLVAASDTGRSSTDNITNDTTPTFTGTCSQGETVYLLVNGANTQPRTRQICPAGLTYSLTPPALSGVPRTAYTFTTQTQSGIGDSAASSALSVMIDAEINPAVVINNPTAGSNQLPNVSVDGTSEAVASVVVTTNHPKGGGCAAGVLANGNVDGSGTGSWTCSNTAFKQGAHTISVVQTDLAGNVAAAVTRSFSVKVSTTTAIASSANPSRFGQPVTFTATVTPGANADLALTGTNVRFVEGATTLATVALDAAGKATYTPSGLGLSVAMHTIQAVYDENTNWLGSSAQIVQDVQKADTTTSVSSSANPSVFGQSVTFTATVAAVSPGAGTPTGTVTFLDGGSSIGTGNLNGSGVATLSISALSVGSHTITASYGSDTNYNGSSGSLNSNPQVVNKANSATTLTSSNNPSILNQSVTFTATVSASAPGAGMPTGTVTFLDGGSSIGTGTLSSGVATLSTSALTVGNHTITTTYAGDGNFNPSAGSLTGNPQVVNKLPTTTTLTSSQNPAKFGQSVTFTATVAPTPPGTGTPTGTVTFLDGGSSIGTGNLNGSGVATFASSTLAVGNHTITANYAADPTFASSTGSLTGNPQVISKADTTTALSSSANPSVFGQPVTFTATITATGPGAGTATGTVTFLDGGSSIGTGTLSSGVATLAISTLIVGNHTITTTYPGDGNFNGSGGALTGNPQVVNHADTTTALTSSQNPSLPGQSVTFTATITAMAPGAGTPTGTMSFLDGGNPLGSGTLSAGVATFTTSALTPGNHTITSSYPGDTHFNSGTGSLTGNPQVVAKFTTNTTIGSVTPPGPITLGSSVNVAASVAVPPPGSGTPTGTITVTSTDTTTNATDTCTFAVPGGTNCTLTPTTVGSKSITAAYGGDGTFAASTSAGTAFSVTPPTRTITGSAGANGSITPATQFVVDGNTGSFTVTPNSGYTASMSTTCPEGLGTLSNNVYTTRPVSGDCAVMATFTAASTSLSLVVNDNRAFARYGGLVNYVVTASNSGGNDVTGLSISGNDTSPSADLDTAGGHWLCFGSAAQCAASGNGPFNDGSVSVPANGSVSWLVTVPVMMAAPDAAASYTVTLSGAGPDVTQTDTDTLVIFHDDFDVAYADGTQIVWPANWDGSAALTFSAPTKARGMIDVVLSATSPDHSGFRLERLTGAERMWLRAVAVDESGNERASAWTPVAANAPLALGLTGTSTRVLVVLGAEDEIDVPIGSAASWQIRSPAQDE
jgi:uncharacterized delta-60 repeat protein